MSADLLPDSPRLAGILTAAELTAAGVTAGRIRSLVRQHVLLPLGRGIYARADPAADMARSRPRGQALRVAAALAVSGPGTVGSHHSAAIIHGLGMFGRPPAEVAVTRAPGGSGSRTGRPGVHVHVAALPATQVTVRHGVRITSVARTVIDLARASSFPAGVAVADSALHDGQTSAAELQRVLSACVRWRGIERARQAIAFADARAESVLESISRVAFHDHGLPPPDLQVWVGDGEIVGRVDFL